MDTRRAAARWADTWVPAWKAHDVEAVAALYAEDCVHHSAPFREPHRGRTGVRAYLEAAFADESDVVDVRFTAPLVDGDHAWVEYRVALRDRDGNPVTLAGSAVARFNAEGLIVESRDYWHEAAGDVPPPEYEHTDAFRGARFTGVDFTGARFRDCDLSRVKIVGAILVDVSVSGWLGNVRVEDVDVTAFVAAELDRRHPERVQVRDMRTAEDYRAAWSTIEQLWAETVARAERLPEAARHERVDEEWSFVETMRHLVFATDLWAGHMVLDQPAPYHRLGLPNTDYPPEDMAALPVEPDSQPSYPDVMAVRAERMALVRGILDELTDDGLERMCTGALPTAWNEPAKPVRACLRVVMNEEIAHRLYAVRDLALLETGRVG